MRVTMPSQDTKPSIISMRSGLRVLRMNHIEFHTDTLELFPVDQTSQLLVLFSVILTAASSSHESRCTQLATFHVCQRHINLISVQFWYRRSTWTGVNIKEWMASANGKQFQRIDVVFHRVYMQITQKATRALFLAEIFYGLIERQVQRSLRPSHNYLITQKEERRGRRPARRYKYIYVIILEWFCSVRTFGLTCARAILIVRIGLLWPTNKQYRHQNKPIKK